jgi:hypothetical protein
MDRPTGIIRTLPSFESGTIGYKKMNQAIAGIERGEHRVIYIALQAIPKVEVLHMYILVDGLITVRLNIAEYIPGYELECWDGSYRKPKHWAVCTGPAVKPPEPIRRKGFQGFRYTEDLW